MPVLVTSKFDGDSIKMNLLAWRHHFPIINLWEFLLDAQGHLCPKGVVRSSRNSNSSEVLSLSSLSTSLTKIGSKQKALAWRCRFPYYRSMNGSFLLPWQPQYWWNLLQNRKAAFPPSHWWYIWSRLTNWSKTWRFHNKYIENIIRPQGRITPNWLIRSGQNSNYTEILCLSWVPASLTKIRLKMNMLAWRNHFPIKRIWENFKTLKGTLLRREWSDLAEIRNCPRFYVCPCYLHVCKRSDKNKKRIGEYIVFPHYMSIIICQWALSVSMETRALIQSAPKLYAPFPPSKWCYT